ncbi:G2 and S phase-expressed protein 1 isoform X2 [Artibeus jamaicensis]|uniref:G2 and S phase-expressed protein 1 isoform X2 n=1 Tax=Artibeus jamaicensis TaxID=9417 RepID=UPI00235A4899|nr:G2 and S phase-expressed protein 1 isoform X2 [Artibeus jamaicensis]
MEVGDSSDVLPARRAGEAEVEGPRKDDAVLLADEKFDFDLSLSSLSANDDEDDEVFFGPVGHRERCVAARLERADPSPEASHVHWSPLTGEKFVEVYKEAHLLAFQIASSSRDQAAGPGDSECQGGERFIQDSKLKMSLFEKENKSKKSPNSLKRETYCLSDSPLSWLQLSGVQPDSGVAPQNITAQAHLTRTWGPPLPSRPSLPLESSPVGPPNQAVTQKKVVSKLPPPRASVRGKSVHLAVEKETPASPSGAEALAEKEPQRDRPPDSPSAAQDVTSVPAHGGHLGPGKRLFPVPSKTVLKRTAPKPPGGVASLAGRPSAPGGFSGRSSRARAPPVASTGGPPDCPTPRLSRAPRPQSCTSSGRAVLGTPARRASGPVSRTPVSTRHVPTLLTPAGRRLSGLPVLTPRTQPRTLASPQRGAARRLSSEPRQRPAVRPAPGSGCSDESSDGSSSPLVAVPQALHFSPEKSNSPAPASLTTAHAAGEAQPPVETAPAEVLLVDIPLEQLRIAPAARSSPPADVALIDFCSPPGACGPLIDLLVNTPDAERSAVAKLLPNMGQLADLCAPLIQLSPEANKENVDSPLLKF